MNTIINVNGRQYDARTGKMLGKAPDAPKILPQKPRLIQQNTVAKSGAILDGVSKPKAFTLSGYTNSTDLTNVAPKTRRISPLRNTPSLDIKPSSHLPQKANTLQRSSVSKPVKNGPIIHSTSSIVNSKVEKSATGRGLLVKRIPDSRLARASQTVKSSVIQKFNTNNISKKPILDQNLSVAKAPVNNSSSRTATVVRSLHKPKLGNPNRATQEKVFTHPSLVNATNHTNPKIPKKKAYIEFVKKFQLNPRIVGSSATIAAVLILCGFLMYQKVPAVALRVANSRAGFNAHMPGDTPAGFTFKGPIQYSKGIITISFASSSDERNFVISQKPTDQTSESLLVSEISGSNKRYQTYHDKGLTVFIFNDGNATWVDKGIQYNIDDNGSLSSEQVLSIAGSM